MGSMSIWHWLIVLFIVLAIFGTRKLRTIGADLGGAVRGFKEGLSDGENCIAKDEILPVKALAREKDGVFQDVR